MKLILCTQPVVNFKTLHMVVQSSTLKKFFRSTGQVNTFTYGLEFLWDSTM